MNLFRSLRRLWFAIGVVCLLGWAVEVQLRAGTAETASSGAQIQQISRVADVDSSEAPKSPAPGQTMPLTPEAALASFRLEPGLQIEFVAAEPLVVDPVAITFDERGRMYVAENRGYPTGPALGQPPIGTIALLEDVDGDGRYERRRTFADGLTFPNGVMAWRGGVLVTCAPDIIFLKDTDHDGKADVRQVLFTGFDAGKTSQLRVSHPTLGIDNWIYATSGLTGGTIRSAIDPDRSPLELRSDFRFHPQTGRFEAADGRGQFGLAFDDFGHRFVCYNRVHIQHVVLPSRYLQRNPHLSFSETIQNVPEALAPEPLKGHGAAARIYPISSNVTTADSHAGTFTAACGLLIFRGTALPDEYYGNAFACDPTANLVHRDLLEPSGATFVARPARAGIEMVASTDNWFRPVNLALGPDGALYICDMYRRTIEHPQYLPEAVRKRTDFVSGNASGRIYRVRSTNAAPERESIDLGAASGVELCRVLEHPNAWQRETAQRLILERQERSVVVPILAEMFQPPGMRLAVARLHALRILDELGELEWDVLKLALRDPLPAVREHALQIAEEQLRSGGDADPTLLFSLADDADARVRFQCALALGEVTDERALAALVRIAIRDASDRWARAAVLSSVHKRTHLFYQKLLRALKTGEGSINRLGELKSASGTTDQRAAIGLLLFETARLIAAWDSDRLPMVLDDLLAIANGWEVHWTRSILNGLAAGARRGTDATPPWSGWIEAQPDGWTRWVEQSLADATNRQLPDWSRLSAVALLANTGFETSGAALLRVIDPAEPAELQMAAVRAIAGMRHNRAAAELLAPIRWASYSPRLQETVIASLIAYPPHAVTVLESVADGSLPAWAISAGVRNQLIKSKDERLRRLAEQVLAHRMETDRMKAFESAKSVLSLPADPRNGRAVFRRHCSTCHRLDREGVAVGPDLFSIRNQPKEAILLHTIVPEYEIVPGYAAYLVETRDGRTLSGIIASETANSVTLRAGSGLEESLARAEISEMTASAVSLMPQGFESVLTPQELADLMAYVKGE